MGQPITGKKLDKLRNGFFDIDPDDVIRDAQSAGLNIATVEDFREQANNYDYIEELMTQYGKKYARYNALGGATTGVGGIATSITLSSIELANTAAHLYRLTQRYAILNGFDPTEPLQKDQINSIYLKTLGFKTASQASIKYVLLNLSTPSTEHSLSKRLFATVITRIVQKIGSNITSKNVKKYIPLIGGAVGAYSSYSYAMQTKNSLHEAFKEQYFNEWYDTDHPDDNA